MTSHLYALSLPKEFTMRLSIIISVYRVVKGVLQSLNYLAVIYGNTNRYRVGFLSEYKFKPMSKTVYVHPIHIVSYNYIVS